MTKTIFLAFFILFIFSVQNACAQKNNNVWVFGANTGLDFNSSPPVPLEISKANGGSPPHYMSSIADKSGNLLFYTDGFTVWNAAHDVVPKYLFRWPWSGFVMPLICPYPSNDSLYYLFGVSKGSYANRLQYLTINMKNPEGEIVYPQPSTLSNYFTVLLQNVSVAIAGTAHCNQKGTWIVAYSAGAFNSFLVTRNGVSDKPIVSTCSLPANLYLGNGNFKFSANGEKLIIPLTTQGKVAVLDFNNATGVFSNMILLSVPGSNILEDVELSPDGSKLYIASYEEINPNFRSENHFVYQMDLDAGTPDQIEKTAYRINGFGNSVICSPRYCVTIRRTMQLAPNGRIYISMRDIDETLSIIEEPNRKGVDAFYREDALNMQKAYGEIGFNYIRSASFNPGLNGILVQKQVCIGTPVNFSLLYKQVDSVKWDFGDPASVDNYSSSLRPSHIYPGAGTYTVQAIIFKNCSSDTASASVTIQPTKPIVVPDFIKDTIVCKGGPLLLNVTEPTATLYKWENGYKFPKREISQPGQYEIFMMNECSFDRKGFTVRFEECECDTYIPAAFTPNNDGLNDVFKPVVKCLAKDYAFKIYNRYGGTYFESSQILKGWDGTVNNKPAPDGVYIWTLQYRNPNNNELIRKQGTIVLIR